MGTDGSSVGAPGSAGNVGKSNAGAPTAAGSAHPLGSLDQLIVSPEPDDPAPYKCLPFTLVENDCRVYTTRTGSACNCQESGLVPSSSSVTDAVRNQLQLIGQCDSESRPDCSSLCTCEYSRAIGTSEIECKSQLETSPESTGWCYVAADGGEQPAELVADCPKNQPQRLRFMGNSGLLAATLDETGARSVYNFLACDNGVTPTPSALGEVCSTGGISDVEEINIADGFAACSSGVCVVNHFQGLVSCPYGQAAGAGECFLAGHGEPIAKAVEPQLVDRQAAVASICSCQCSGSGPGPYCTCPESMQCEHLVDDLHLGSASLAGSYCIPKGSEYYADQQAVCVEPNCGAKHPY